MAVAVTMTGSLAGAATVNGFGPGSSWADGSTAGGTAEIVNLTGTGGNLESNAPDNNDAAKITTADDNASRAEVGTGANFGQVSDIFNGASLSVTHGTMMVPILRQRLHISNWRSTTPLIPGMGMVNSFTSLIGKVRGDLDHAHNR